MRNVADEGWGLLAGLNVISEHSFLSRYSSRVGHRQIVQLLSAYHAAIASEKLFDGDSFNLDVHSLPFYGEHPIVERHFVAMRSRRVRFHHRVHLPTKELEQMPPQYDAVDQRAGGNDAI